MPYSEIVARGQNPSKSKICQKMAMFKQLNGPISSKLKIKFDPSVERFWCELFKIIKRTWSKKSTQKVLPGLLHKLLFHKMKLGLVFRPYIKMSLPVSHRSQMNFLSNTPPIWWWDCDLCWFKPMAVPVVEFSWEGYKIRKVFGQKSTVAKWNNWILWIGVPDGEVSKSAEIWLSKSIFYVKNHRHLSHFFSLKNINLGSHIFFELFYNINF